MLSTDFTDSTTNIRNSLRFPRLSKFMESSAISSEPSASASTRRVENIVIVLRIGMFLMLSGLIGAIGSTSFLLLSSLESKNFETVYDSSVDQISTIVAKNLQSKIFAGLTVNYLYSYAIESGYIGTLPNVTLPGYEDIVGSLTKLASARGIIFYPILTADNRRSWEEYAIRNVEYIGNSSAIRDAVSAGIYRQLSEGKVYDNATDILTPVWQSTPLASFYKALMYNAHSETARANAIDAVLRTKQPALSDILQLIVDDSLRPSSILFSPIIDRKTSQVAALSAALFSWDDLLQDALPSYISELLVVLRTKSKAFTFSLDRGAVCLKGVGDLHEHSMSTYGRPVAVFLGEKNSDIISEAEYTLTVYPTRQLRATYVTDTPAILCGSFVAIIMFTAVLVLCYDYAVGRKQKRLLQGILESKIRLADMTLNELHVKKNFVRYISHEVRTPLNIVVLGLTFMQSRLSAGAVDGEVLQVIEDIQHANAIAIEILDNLLTYEKLTSNVLELSKTHLPLVEYVEESLRPFYLQTRAAGQTLDVFFSADLTGSQAFNIIHLDKAKIGHVIRNLLSNAVKYSPKEGTVAVRVSVCDLDLRRPPSRSVVQMLNDSLVGESDSEKRTGKKNTVAAMRLEVIDHGIGISKENQQRLFKEIVQFTPGELQDGQGCGLSLWISHQIVALHEGRLYVESQGQGHGCRFVMELPLPIQPRNRSQPGSRSNSRRSLLGFASYKNWMTPSSPAGNEVGNIQKFVVPLERSLSDAEFNLDRSLGRSLRYVPSQQAQPASEVAGGWNSLTSVSGVVLSKMPSSREGTLFADSSHNLNLLVKRKSGTLKDLNTSPSRFEAYDHYSSDAEQEIGDTSDVGNRLGRRPSRLVEAAALHSARILDLSRDTSAALEFSNVLVVDDVGMNRKMMIRVLRQNWSNISEAEDGIVALGMVVQAIEEDHPYDLILMDYQMPNMNGPEAVRLMRQAGHTGIIIGITGNGVPSDIDLFLASGADKVLLKPLRLELLETTLIGLGTSIADSSS